MMLRLTAGMLPDFLTMVCWGAEKTPMTRPQSSSCLIILV